jgi:hypothetical protein
VKNEDMDEIEKLKRAKMYIDKLANGIDPISNIEMPNDTILNNVRLSRCFFYVSDVLRQVIDNNGMTKLRVRKNKQDFFITNEQKRLIDIVNAECYLKDFVEKINTITEPNNCKKFQAKWVNLWLLSNEYLAEYTDKAGIKRKKATTKGEEIGLRSVIRKSLYGTYTVTLLNPHAQQLIIDNLDEILKEFSSAKNVKTAEYQGALWSSEHEEILIDLFNKKVPIREIAVTLKRTEAGILARLKKLGITEQRIDPRN